MDQLTHQIGERIVAGMRVGVLALALLLQPLAPVAASELTDQTMVVEVVGGQYQYQYLVGGVPTAIRGMGYNAIYHHLPPATRLARLDRDFAMMEAAGVNTLVSWYPEEFDRLLLDLAQAHGIGVIMPFDLPTTLDYGDPDVRLGLKSAALDWVIQYRSHPAVRMWGIGNEVMLNMDEAEARAFAEFYADLVLAVRAADPDHPVVYREAEDVFVPHLRDAMAAVGGPPSGFVYGVNIYTPRLAKILEGWPDLGFDVPLMVSEFAPAGLPRASRPDGFRAMWDTIRTFGSLVFGAAPYVWMTEGPEAVDLLFGFVDADGRPVDDSLATLRALYGGTGDLALLTSPIGVVPSLVGLPEAEARRQVGAAGLGDAFVGYVGLAEIADPGLLDRVPPGVVLIQEPAAGTLGNTDQVVLVVMGNADGTPPPALLLEEMLDDVLARAAEYAAAATGTSRDEIVASAAIQREIGLHQQLGGIEPDADVDPTIARLADLVAWSKVFSEVTVDGRRVFPGAREALPLLAGMTRWGFDDHESLNTAQRFLRDVLIRDLVKASPLPG
ncbi:MAG: hypothetical protein HY331_09805 [Chloroflexi bacterium]|nr:hypothetical protein [Chloroflexota bacterium]